MSSKSSGSKCATCGKPPPRPTLVCGDCSEGVDIIDRKRWTPYCTALCRQHDRTTHQKQCDKANRRKQIYRAGQLLQTIFYQFRNLSFDLKIAEVQSNDNLLIIYDAEFSKKESMMPDDLPEGLSVNNKDGRTLLSYQACSEACIHFYKLSKKLLMGASRTIEEVELLVDHSLCKVKRIAPDGKTVPVFPMHIVFAVETIDADVFVFDIAGAQFGQPCPVLPLEAFMEAYQKPVISVISRFGSAHSRNIQMMERRIGRPRKDIAALALQAHMAAAFDDCLEPWEEKRQISFHEMVDSPQSRWFKLRDNFISVASLATIRGMRVMYGPSEDIVDVRKLIQMLERVPLIPRPSMVLVTNSREGTAMHRVWVAQHKARLQALRGPLWWDMYEPRLEKGGSIIVRLNIDDDPNDEKAAVEAANAIVEGDWRSKMG
ncbi:hypothetical protein CKM354_001089400 [Cercospora kikuchii]|uniref:Suppressor of anucleate metulae protein B n=1 Tax=Cercospora kikuchii TaxID=84275 RepID=A0A9P3CUG5_9PEZI|nr:uncharacterized protein CKM354_001089400 [Cercospora kikuchii]GIZ47812.1 hypothetical protein CKM354_001089400 [Cercospora kikuchii]